jgi:hypothetical protein
MDELRELYFNRDSEKGLDGVAPFIERNFDSVASTLEWRGRILHAQEPEARATQLLLVPAISIREGRWRASLELEISEYDNTIMIRRGFWIG